MDLLSSMSKHCMDVKLGLKFKEEGFKRSPLYIMCVLQDVRSMEAAVIIVLAITMDLFYMDNREFLAMADAVEQQCLKELYGMDWYNPTCYAIKILDAK